MLAPEILKQQVATAAFEYLLPRLSADSIIGIGTGSTANCFIDQLPSTKTALPPLWQVQTPVPFDSTTWHQGIRA